MLITIRHVTPLHGTNLQNRSSHDVTQVVATYRGGIVFYFGCTRGATRKDGKEVLSFLVAGKGIRRMVIDRVIEAAPY